MTRQLSVAHLTAIDASPPELIEAAAQAGFDAVGLRLLRVTPDSPGYPLMTDRPMLRATQTALRESGLRVNDIEFVKIDPAFELDRLLPLLDVGAALGAGYIITAPYDPDLNRLADALSRIGEAAAARGMAAALEFFPWTCVSDLAACRDVVEAAGPHTRILIDALHFDRSGSTLATLLEIPAQRLPFMHLCDAPVRPPYTTEALLHAARAHRLPPGAGEIDLKALLSALPPAIPIGLEVPNPAPEEALTARLRRLRRATLKLLESARVA